METVLILDNDLGFIFWLGRALSDSGFDPLPATSVRDALALLSHGRTKVVLLIANPALEGVDRFVDNLRCFQGQVRTIAALEDEDDDPVSMIAGADACQSKPTDGSDAAITEWLRLVNSIVSTSHMPGMRSQSAGAVLN